VKRVLLIDDAATIRLYHRMILEPLGFEVEEAANGYEALEKIASRPFDLLLLDVNMPGTSGIDMLKKIRSSERLQPVVVMLTNQKEKIYKDTCLSLGADYYLDKSKDFLCLPEIIRALSAKRA
jgi:two-component system chemotaxis response regulator CheY